MRISDWSSDVCSSDLSGAEWQCPGHGWGQEQGQGQGRGRGGWHWRHRDGNRDLVGRARAAGGADGAAPGGVEGLGHAALLHAGSVQPTVKNVYIRLNRIVVRRKSATVPYNTLPHMTTTRRKT